MYSLWLLYSALAHLELCSLCLFVKLTGIGVMVGARYLYLQYGRLRNCDFIRLVQLTTARDVHLSSSPHLHLLARLQSHTALGTSRNTPLL
ncbi:hypothetical protein PYCCODRAFT_749314 [Trametes coccinea BRFM310]|uniref:Uncharacterized protein n=1 Tax=Trametes coccinea (strain BRFM310) TaxID=1353009 RepID=A0A1Y2IFA4_TRAC3|nr:hypothetical protein PYCCODRAFT_749314 [Trametes coccinea BRFM310]